MSDLPSTLVVMGVCGCGKSLVGARLAAVLNGVFDDGDDFHPAANKAKMASGTPLADADRWPWFDVLRARMQELRGKTPVHVIGCSALKKSYRDYLRGTDEPENMRFVLLEGTRELIAARLAARKGHFMPPALLDSQLATLELSDDLLRVSIDQEPDAIVREIVEKLHGAA